MTIPFHGDATSVANLHRPGFVSESDPAAETGMAPWKLWIEVDGSNAFVALHLRNAANDDWITVITADDLATQAELDAAIAALKDGVSTSFDTLAELATTLLDHHTRHESGGADAIKLDDLAAPDDNTDLDVSITAHGLAPKLPNDAAKFLNGVGSYTTPTGSGIPATIVDAKGDLIAATAVDTVARLPVGSNGQRIKANSAQSTGLEWVDEYATIPFVIDGGGAVITTGLKGGLQVDIAGTIVAATVLALDNLTGSIVIDIWKDTYANHPPTVADTITASAKPTVSSAVKSTDTTLTGWTTSVAAGDVLFFNVDSVSTFQRVLVSLQIKKA